MTSHENLTIRRRHSHELAAMPAAERLARHHLLALRDLLIDRDVKIGK